MIKATASAPRILAIGLRGLSASRPQTAPRTKMSQIRFSSFECEEARSSIHVLCWRRARMGSAHFSRRLGAQPDKRRRSLGRSVARMDSSWTGAITGPRGPGWAARLGASCEGQSRSRRHTNWPARRRCVFVQPMVHSMAPYYLCAPTWAARRAATEMDSVFVFASPSFLARAKRTRSFVGFVSSWAISRKLARFTLIDLERRLLGAQICSARLESSESSLAALLGSLARTRNGRESESESERESRRLDQPMVSALKLATPDWQPTTSGRLL